MIAIKQKVRIIGRRSRALQSGPVFGTMSGEARASIASTYEIVGFY